MATCTADSPQLLSTGIGLEEVVAKKLPQDYDLKRGSVDAFVYTCEKTGTVLVHHIDDFDICGRESVMLVLLTAHFRKKRCKLKFGEMESLNAGGSSTSESWSQELHLHSRLLSISKTILIQPGSEDAKPGPVPGRKLDQNQDKPLQCLR